MPIRYRIMLLLKRFETGLFIMLFVLLVMVCLWSLKTPNRNTVLTEELELNKKDSTDFKKDSETESWQENGTKLTDINNNLDAGNLAKLRKTEESNIDTGSINEIFIQQSPKLKERDKVESQPITGANKKSVNSRKLSRGTSYSNQFPVFKKKEFGYLSITLANAHEYGYGYVAIDGSLWQEGEQNTTPLKIKLTVGNHRVEVKRDGFVSSPGYKSIFIEKNVEKRVSFILIPEKK
ncbi:MAG: hypothetical protein JSW07_04515 [bacterium]|nr:MAG: hypothetical protein JSW07_04515 [bacterium]